MTPWMIYGANGYTGELIAREAARRGHRPIIAGRNAEALDRLARELNLEARVFPVEQPHLAGVGLVLHCAGPFSRTSAPMVDACLHGSVHYLDITGEISVFEAIMARSAEAVRAGVTLLPGVGFDVVPTDCIAATLAQRLPGATHLELAFSSRRGGLSPGTLKTMIEGIGEGGAVRRDGKIVRVPFAWDVREIPFATGSRTAMTIPWGDVSTAFHTTGIPNIRVYNASSPKSIRRSRLLMRAAPLLGTRPIRSLLQKLAGRRKGPDEKARERSWIDLWGRASNGTSEVTMTMTTPEGYTFTMLAALAAVENVLSSPLRAGSFTPARYFGADFAATIVARADATRRPPRSE